MPNLEKGRKRKTKKPKTHMFFGARNHPHLCSQIDGIVCPPADFQQMPGTWLSHRATHNSQAWSSDQGSHMEHGALAHQRLPSMPRKLQVHELWPPFQPTRALDPTAPSMLAVGRHRLAH